MRFKTSSILRKYLSALCVAALFPLGLQAQQLPVDSIAPSAKVKDTTAEVHSVKRATILSAVLPGAGQVYNRKYWKVPVLYAGFAGMAYLIHFNNTNYKDYNNALIARLDDDPATIDVQYPDKYSDADLRTLSDYYHRNRDLSVVVTALIYAINIIDAHVDAELFTFDVSDDLSLRIEPTLIPRTFDGFTGYNLGLQLNLQF